MKRILSFLTAVLMMLSLCGCQGSYGKINLQEPVEIPGDGMIEVGILKQIKNENAIAVFTGQSNGLRYEWTIFGSDIENPGEINLQAVVEKTSESIQVKLAQEEAFGFPVLLSIYLDEMWAAQSATAYASGSAVSSVSLTGSSHTILNLSMNQSLGTFEIRPDALLEENLPEVPGETTGNEITMQGNHQVFQSSDNYLSAVTDSSGRVYSDGTQTEKDQYLTDPVPAGKPMPVEPENQQVNKGSTYTCTFSIECSTILNNLDMLDPDKLEMVPSNGTILPTTTVTFYEGESVFDVLQRVCMEKGIHMEAAWTPIYNSAYVEGIHNLYEFDCGALSGWMYKVNGWYPNYGSSRYQLKDGDVVEWRFTCDLGNDVGGGYAVGG